jgi:hypothetical protein
VVVRIAATPARADEGPQLADQILAAVGEVTRDVDGRARPASHTSQDEDGTPRVDA